MGAYLEVVDGAPLLLVGALALLRRVLKLYCTVPVGRQPQHRECGGGEDTLPGGGGVVGGVVDKGGIEFERGRVGGGGWFQEERRGYRWTLRPEGSGALRALG